EGRGSAQLLRAFSEMLKKTLSPRDEMITSNFVTRFTLRTSHSELLPTQLPDVNDPVIPPELQAEAFWCVRDLSDCCAPIRRVVCFACYSAGFALAGIIVLQNAYAVVRLSF